MGFNQIQTGRFNRLIQKLFSIKGAASLTEIGAEIIPSLNIDLGVEARYLQSWERFAGLLTVAAVSTKFGVVQLRNPLGSNVVAVIEQATFTNISDTPLIQILTSTNTDLTTVVALTNTALDGRTRQNPSLIYSTENDFVAALTGTVAWAGSTGAANTVDAIIDENQEIPILPNTVVKFAANTANVAVRVAVKWRERTLEESELR
jgi:hypothetical protein